jgi:hypothetical protein
MRFTYTISEVALLDFRDLTNILHDKTSTRTGTCRVEGDYLVALVHHLVCVCRSCPRRVSWTKGQLQGDWSPRITTYQSYLNGSRL